jgi:cellulose synthase/poly-beta-1,6-N-acetylglucosamine synthase-like glycosyltransferase
MEKLLMPTVAVVTPAYNEQDGIVGYLESLTQQTYPDFVVTIIDDGSTDRTPEIIESFRDRLDIQVSRTPHLGWKIAKARGTAAATTDICIVFDADSIIDPNCIKHIVEAFANPAVGAVGGQTRSLGNAWVVRGAQLVREVLHKFRKKSDDEGWILTGACMAFRTDVLRQIGGLTEAQQMVGQDIEVSWRLQKAGIKVVTLDNAIVYHHEPETVGAMFKRQFTFGRKAVYTYWLYRDLWTNWKLWVRFYPLALLGMALLWPPSLLPLLLATYVGALWLFRKSGAPLMDKTFGWIVLTLHSVAYTAGFIWESANQLWHFATQRLNLPSSKGVRPS